MDSVAVGFIHLPGLAAVLGPAESHLAFVHAIVAFGFLRIYAIGSVEVVPRKGSVVVGDKTEGRVDYKVAIKDAVGSLGEGETHTGRPIRAFHLAEDIKLFRQSGSGAGSGFTLSRYEDSVGVEIDGDGVFTGGFHLPSVVGDFGDGHCRAYLHGLVVGSGAEAVVGVEVVPAGSLEAGSY